MAVKILGEEVEDIVLSINGVSQPCNFFKVNGTTVYTKKYSLTKSGTNTYITVMKGTTAVNAGKTLLHGDVLAITVTPHRGYIFNSLKVNGVEVANNSEHTVYGDVAVLANSYLPTCNKCTMNNALCRGCTTGFGSSTDPFMLNNTSFMELAEPNNEEE